MIAYIIEYSSIENSFIRTLVVGGYIKSSSGAVWVLDKNGFAYSEYFFTHKQAIEHLKKIKNGTKPDCLKCFLHNSN